ncbi:Protein of unknown function YGGT [Candidatus Magnetomorum sp. HK-1]|nr:Protein of unknown function YGGT [Candidatus Magnetomorum sp. HK-1]
MESIIGSLIKAIGSLIHIGLMIYIWCIIIRAIISWVNPDPYNPAVRFLYQITDPVFFRIRQWIPMDFGGIDFSPIILIFGLYFIDDVSLNFFQGLSASLLGHQAFHGTHIFAYFLKALAGVTHSILWILMILVIGRAILSFVNPDPYNPIVRFIYQATDPAINFFRSRLPLEYAEFDFSPLILLLVLYLLDSIIVTTLYSAAMSFML